jgi:hypothetical protein
VVFVTNRAQKKTDFFVISLAHMSLAIFVGRSGERLMYPVILMAANSL